MNELLSYLRYDFVINAFIVGALISLCASLLGVTLVLRGQSMIGDGLSHVAFGALALATVLRAAPLAFSLPIVIIAAVILLRISENSSIGGDAAIAMISTASLAIGVVAVSLSGMNTDISAYMFGSLTAIGKGDVVLSVALSGAVLVFYLLFFNRIFAFTFDEGFSRARGLHCGVYKTASAVITAVMITLGMRVMGAMLISALIIFPSISAMRLFKSFKGVTVCSAVLSVLSALIGVSLSCVFSLPTGAAIVLTNAAIFLLSSFAGRLSKTRSK